VSLDFAILGMFSLETGASGCIEKQHWQCASKLRFMNIN